MNLRIEWRVAEVADTIATSFRCGRNAADYHGTRGPKAGDPMLYHGDQP
jgi:hypothetical protein